MALTPSQNRMVEHVRNGSFITIEMPGDDFRLMINDSGFAHDVALALQKYYNDKNAKETVSDF